jgi:hypothetical protein
MIAGHEQSKAAATGSPALMLEIPGRKKLAPLRIPVIIQNLSMGGLTLTVSNPWGTGDWDRYQGEECVLRVEGYGDQEIPPIKAKIAWTKFDGNGQPPLSLGLHLMKSPGEARRLLSNLLPHTLQDIKGLWDRYDQVRQIPPQSHLLHHCYIGGLVLLIGGLALQITGSPAYKMWGWLLWLLGSLGVAGKIIWPLWQKRASGEQIGKTL